MYLMHCHHDALIEYTKRPRERFRYVENLKPRDEIELRFALLTVIDGKDAELLDAAYARYEKVRDAAWAELDKACASAWAEYGKYAPTWAECEKVRDSAFAELDKVCGAALAEYEKVRDEIHKRRCHPNCPWDGKTIFARGEDAMKALWPDDSWDAAQSPTSPAGE